MSTFSTSTEQLVQRAWSRRGWLAWLLFPLSLLMLLVVRVRRRLYATGILSSDKLPVPVIVVGNIFVGGTGKTPFVIWLVEALRAAGLTPGVVSRGYGRTLNALHHVQDDSTPAQSGDEPLLVYQSTGCPVVVGRRRAEAARHLLDMFPQVDVIIADDGLQHYALARDIEIVLSDGRGEGNGWLLPAGPLREPPSRPRDFSVVNIGAGGELHRKTGPTYRMFLENGQAYALANPDRQQPLAGFAGKAGVVAMAGIGNPQRFFDGLQAAGIDCATVTLPDHASFDGNPFAQVQADIFLITEKDAVKCRAHDAILADSRIWVVPVTTRIDGDLSQRIVEKLREFPIA